MHLTLFFDPGPLLMSLPWLLWDMLLNKTAEFDDLCP